MVKVSKYNIDLDTGISTFETKIKSVTNPNVQLVTYVYNNNTITVSPIPISVDGLIVDFKHRLDEVMYWIDLLRNNYRPVEKSRLPFIETISKTEDIVTGLFSVNGETISNLSHQLGHSVITYLPRQEVSLDYTNFSHWQKFLSRYLKEVSDGQNRQR